MQTSKLADSVTPSKGRMLFNMAKKYNDVIDLTLGDPDILPPAVIREAGCQAIMDGKTRYSANAGLFELREAYLNYINKKYDTSLDPECNVIVTVGGMEALYLALISSVDPGDEVIVFSPYYTNYYQMIKMCGAVPVVVKTKPEDSFIPNTELLKKAISKKSKLILINSPSNPTGAVYPKDIIEAIVKIAKDYNLLLISDEVYNQLVYEEVQHESLLSFYEEYKDIIVIDSCSKRFSMTGWRVGFAMGSSDWITAMIKLQENVAACAPLPSQYAALRAFSNPLNVEYITEIFKRRRDLLSGELSISDKLSFNVPDGTFYLFVNIGKTKLASMDFAMELLKEKHVAVVPGIAYGDDFDDFIRIAFTVQDKQLREAAKRIVNFCEKTDY